MSTQAKIHVVIVGGGLGGLAAAISALRSGHRVTILEQAAVLGEIGAGIQIPPNSSRILKRWGLLPKLEAVSVRPLDFIHRSYRDGKILSRANMFPEAEGRYGVPYLHIHRADYHRILVEEAKRLGVSLLLGQNVVDIDFEKPAAYMTGGSSISADLIVGADGLKSVCRECMLGRPDPPHLTGDLAYRVIIPASAMRSHPLLAPLVEKPAIQHWLGPSAHAVGYLLQGGNLFNVVLCCPDDLPEQVSVAKANVQEMRELFTGWDPQLRALLELVQEISKWRLQHSHEMEAWNHPSGKFTLLGDACHATLPYLAQGAAMAVEDGAVLGELLAKLSSPAQIPKVLAVYEKMRKPRTTSIVRGSAKLRDIFHMHDGPKQVERDRTLLESEPFEGFPNRWKDPVFAPFMFDYDTIQEVEKAWAQNVEDKARLSARNGAYVASSS